MSGIDELREAIGSVEQRKPEPTPPKPTPRIKPASQPVQSWEKAVYEIREAIESIEQRIALLEGKILKPRNEHLEEIFEHWNSQGIIKHRFTKEIERAISGKLRDYTVEEIKRAISNYAEVLRGDFYFKYRWTLKDFLKRGIDKFLDGEIAKGNYRNLGSNSAAQQAAPHLKSFADEFPEGTR
jgi:hypothetical protein